MQRIAKIDPAAAPAKTNEMLDAVKRQLGGVPAIFQTIAQSPAALAGFLGFLGALGAGKLSAKLREQIALACAGANACDYCASAHSALGKKVGLASDEMTRNLRADSGDSRSRAALLFVRKVVAERGHVTDADLATLRAASFSDEEIVEIIANVALNIFTNYFNHIAATEIDFPAVSATSAKAA
ncbi:MAG: carboxymuconolactone decarboxylase family protein [Pseudolabrys sp.]